jgi:response regulator of citrate/malate metabolism
VLDFYLPGITGGESLGAIRTRDQETEVIVISSSQDYGIVHDVFKLGADAYLTNKKLTNGYRFERPILAGLEKKKYQRAMARNEVVRQRMDAITTIIRTVHHELNTPGGHHRPYIEQARLLTGAHGPPPQGPDQRDPAQCPSKV